MNFVIKNFIHINIFINLIFLFSSLTVLDFETQNYEIISSELDEDVFFISSEIVFDLSANLINSFFFKSNLNYI